MSMAVGCRILHRYRGWNRNSCSILPFHINTVQVTFFTITRSMNWAKHFSSCFSLL